MVWVRSTSILSTHQHRPTQAAQHAVVSAWARENPHAHVEATRSHSANIVYPPKQTEHAL